MQLTIGADPEVFVKTGGKFISGHIFNCGTKEAPLKTRNGHVQVDGLALEFNVTPSKTAVQFVRSVRGVLNDLNKVVKAKDKDASIAAIPTVFFGEDYIQSLPADVSKLGCNPDFNAYTEDVNVPPDATVPFRTGAGHVHLGFRQGNMSYEHFLDCCALARELDYYLGLPSLDFDTDNQRRSLYGQAGAFRPKPYGLEYRVLSNAWINDDNLIRFVFDQTKKCYDRFRNGVSLNAKYGDFAKECINGNLDWKTILPQVKDDI